MPVTNYEFSFEHLLDKLTLQGELSIFYRKYFYPEIGLDFSKPASKLIAFNVVKLLGYLEDTVYFYSNTKRQ